MIHHKFTNLVEMVANVDETLGEQFLADMPPTVDELIVCYTTKSTKRRGWSSEGKGGASKALLVSNNVFPCRPLSVAVC